MGKGDNRAKKHHYVPCMLLGRFAEGGDDLRARKVWVWDKETGKVWSARADAIGYQNDLYTIPADRLAHLDAEDIAQLPPELQGEQAMENMFSMMERSLAQIIDIIETKLVVLPAGSDALVELLTAVTLFDLRTPAKMEEARQLTEAMMNMVAEMNIPDFTDDMRVSVPFKQNRPQLLASTLQHLPDVMEYMLKRNWSLRVSTDSHFILSDYPVQYVFSREPRQRWDVPAPAIERTLALFPLTKTVLLTGEYETKSAVRVADSRWVGYHNTRAVMHAERFLFTFSDSFVTLTDSRGAPAYEAIGGSEEQLFEMTPELFARGVRDGLITKPRRLTINGVAPEDYRLDTPTSAVLRDAPSSESRVVLKHTLLDAGGDEVPLTERFDILRNGDDPGSSEPDGGHG